MPKDLTDAELVRRVRGDTSQVLFAEKLGVAQSMLSDWERGAVKPRKDTWLKMGGIAPYPFNVFCWQRAGFTRQMLSSLLEAMRQAIEADDNSLDGLKAKQMLAVVSPPEPVTEPLADEPVGGEPAALKGPSKTVEEFWARNRVLPPAEPVTEESKPKTRAKVKRGKGTKR